MPAFGRKPKTPDARDYSMTKLEEMIKRGEARPVSWDVPKILDQGQKPHCVAFGIEGMLNTDDETHTNPDFDNEDADKFYYEIKDEEGESGQENGAEIRDGLKLAKNNGWINAYAALNSVTEILSWLEKHGPVLVGTNWTQNMMELDNQGYVNPTGQPLGGHCWFQRGAGENNFLCINSWGESWGQKGTFMILQLDFDFLLQAGGEAWAVVEAPTVPVPNPAPVPEPNPCKCRICQIYQRHRHMHSSNYCGKKK